MDEIVESLKAVGIKVESGGKSKKYFTIDGTNLRKDHKMYGVESANCKVYSELGRAVLTFNNQSVLINSDRVIPLAFTKYGVLVLWRKEREVVYNGLEQQELQEVAKSATTFHYED